MRKGIRLLAILVLVVFFACVVNYSMASKETTEIIQNQPLQEAQSVTVASTMNKNDMAMGLKIVDKPIKMSGHRVDLAIEYARIHYGMEISMIIPQVIVLHWTASNDADSTYEYFYPEEVSGEFYKDQGRLNVASHFLIDRDGTIFRLTPEDFFNRHIIGLNWCSIGIENVGGVNGKQDLTTAQIRANIDLVRYLKKSYPTVKYLIGHYQQNEMKTTGLWRENVSGYVSRKIDPGPIFMKAVIAEVSDLGLITFAVE